ncbi:HNH endonuclease signature motif containing protein [Branchiibius sp. NY16-3462-2]|uniref:HNH endonuclease signature motif containing protein n=1 Tax=Branchiibius sp. NY16-3462-2 TaxID=1807500 RepID=UPI000795C99E|nr:HNH endonuclease signature motif containing protein [Branchiibius sp. NY16-3462-2]KYH42967.1 hypothetical protein AZH51_05795 [Branchiibius sp. NY16-3462-2]
MMIAAATSGPQVAPVVGARAVAGNGRAVGEFGLQVAAWASSNRRSAAVLRGVAGAMVEPELIDTLQALGRARAALDRIEVELVREGITRGLPAQHGQRPVNWVREIEGQDAPPPDAGQATRTVRLATAAALGPDAMTERTMESFFAGGLSAVKTDQLLRFVDDVQAVTDPVELAGVVEAMRAGSVDGPDALPVTDDSEASPVLSALPAWVGTPPPAAAGVGWGLTSRELGKAIGHTRRHLKPADLLAEEESAARRGRALHSLPGPGGLTQYQLTLDAEGAALIDAAVAALSTPVPGPHGEPDPRRAAHRRADALLAIVQRGMEAGGSVPGQAKAQVVVTISLADLLAEAKGAGVTGTGQVLSPEAVRRWACDAGIIPMVLGGLGQPLDVGRMKRLITDAQRLALWQRDRGCTFPGCNCPPQWCDGHHLTAWARGGKTNLDQLALLCRRHHTYVHEHQLTATLTPTGVRWNLQT